MLLYLEWCDVLPVIKLKLNVLYSSCIDLKLSKISLQADLIDRLKQRLGKDATIMDNDKKNQDAELNITRLNIPALQV